jgi:hypothetical protein
VPPYAYSDPATVRISGVFCGQIFFIIPYLNFMFWIGSI